MKENALASNATNWLKTLHKSPFSASAPGSQRVGCRPPRAGAQDLHIWRGFSRPNPTRGSEQRPSSPFRTQGAPHTRKALRILRVQPVVGGGRKLGPTSSLPVSPDSGRGTPTRPGRAEPEDRKEDSGKSQAKREKSERVKERVKSNVREREKARASG